MILGMRVILLNIEEDKKGGFVMLMEIIAKAEVFLKSRKGQGMTEYAVVVALVVAIAVAVLSTDSTLSNAIKNVFTSIAGKLANV